MPHASFDGLRVLSLESRRAREVEKLIRTYSGEPMVVPSMREIPLASNTACLDFGRDLLAGRLDAVIFMTGVGVRGMMRILETEFSRAAILDKLRGLAIISRGVKPQAALVELGVPIAVQTPEPATWREVMAAIDTTFAGRTGTMRVAVQEYGASNPEMLSELVDRFDSVTKVPIYQWALPEDIGPLRAALQAILDGGIDVVLFMTAVQVLHLFQVAEEQSLVAELRQAFLSTVVISVGPTTTEELQQHGVQPDFEPSRPKMGFMINEAAQYSGKMLASKQTPRPPSELSVPASASPASASWRTNSSQEQSVQQVSRMTSTMAGFKDGLAPLDILHEIGSRIALADPLHLVLERIMNFVSTVIPCDSCFVYTLEEDHLLLRASKNPHSDQVDKLNVPVGQGITGWVARHRESVAIPEHASDDPRFSFFASLPEDRFQAMLCTPIVCANRVIGVITVQHRERYQHTDLQQRLLATLGILVGAEIERARLETENYELAHRLESRKVVDRAKGILQQELSITEEEAYRKMQSESRQRRRSMREIAEAVLLSADLRKVP